MVLTLALPVSVRAQYYSINVDYQTMAAMSEAYTTENAMEMLHNENLQKIYDSYKAAEVASAAPALTAEVATPPMAPAAAPAAGP